MGTSKRKKVAPVSCVGCVRRLSPLCRRTVQRQYRGRRQWLALFGIRAKTNKYSLSLSLFHFSASLAIGIYMDRNGSRARRGFTRLAARSISFSNWIWFIKIISLELKEQSSASSVLHHLPIILKFKFSVTAVSSPLVFIGCHGNRWIMHFHISLIFPGAKCRNGGRFIKSAQHLHNWISSFVFFLKFLAANLNWNFFNEIKLEMIVFNFGAFSI